MMMRDVVSGESKACDMLQRILGKRVIIMYEG